MTFSGRFSCKNTTFFNSCQSPKRVKITKPVAFSPFWVIRVMKKNFTFAYSITADMRKKKNIIQ